MSGFKDCLAIAVGAAIAATAFYATHDNFKRDVDGLLKRGTPRITVDISKDFKEVTIPGFYSEPGKGRVWYVQRGEAERKLEIIVGRDGNGKFERKGELYDKIDANGDGYINVGETDSYKP